MVCRGSCGGRVTGAAIHVSQRCILPRSDGRQMSSFSYASTERPTNNLVGPLLTDMYQISMTYAHWKNRRTEDQAVFDLFFRKNPFDGEYTVFAGQDEVVKFLNSFQFTDSDVAYLQSIMPGCENDFFVWLQALNCQHVQVYAMSEGSIAFPKEPVLRIEGPLGITQLLETTLLNLVNFPSLVATNACRMRLAAGPRATLLEFGVRRAQGPDGGVSATKYSYIGGFDGTSNVLAGKLTGISVKGTHAHAYIQSYTGLSDLHTTKIATASGEVEFLQEVLQQRGVVERLLGVTTNESELAAMVSYAQAFPNGLVALVDTYDVMKSGVPNFIIVSLALLRMGCNPVGIRLDSGDLAFFSKWARKTFAAVDAELKLGGRLAGAQIVASNDINEDVLLALNREGHEIDTFGIGTHLVTCQKQPALGCVYKLVEINGNPRIKLSAELEKLVIPCKKRVYRLFGADGVPLIDVMTTVDEEAPTVGKKMLCRHPFQENRRANVTPSRVQELLHVIWDGKNGVVAEHACVSIDAARRHCREQIALMRSDIVRCLNPAPYKVAVSERLYDYMHTLWLHESPVGDLF